MAGGFIIAIFPSHQEMVNYIKQSHLQIILIQDSGGALICHFDQLSSKLLSVALCCLSLSPQETEGIVEVGVAVFIRLSIQNNHLWAVFL